MKEILQKNLNKALGLNKKESYTVYKIFCQSLKEAIIKKDKVSLKGIGKLRVATRNFFNPSTRKKDTTNTLRFTAYKSIRDILNK